ncbi:MAG: hypothetical protein WAW85_08285 [Gordonia sp. (in: high G+C Gram-positive bacteria)]|uniref:hypothetical protein n=1 Tax=Gordonia sp. (in: high G+C Gram-positive bacteria) TaxID=84139 RepID=UPI003BB72F19
MSSPQLTPKMINPTAPGVPFGREVAVELRKLIGTRGPRVLLGLLVLIWVITALVLLLTSGHLTFGDTLTGFSAVSRIFVGLLAILLVTGEWGQRAVMSVFTLEPRRERVIGAKLCAVLIGAVAIFVVAVAMAAAIVAIRGGSFDFAAAAFRMNGLRALFDVLMAFAIALAILNTAGAVVGYLALPEIIMPLLLMLFTLPTAGNSGSNVYESVAPWVYPQEMFRAFASTNVPGEAWAHLLVCAVLWIGLPAIIGVRRVMSSEVK